MKEEWGPWIEHDGKGCPCVGEYVHRIFERICRNIVTGDLSDEAIGVILFSGSSWFWDKGFVPVVRYRIRKPKGMAVLESILADLPAPMPWDVTA